MKPSLHHLIEDHFKPKWWQFFRKQKYHVCQNHGPLGIYEVPNKCIVSGDRHSAKMCARVIDDKIRPYCHDGCPEILASDPAFFQKLDEWLARGCYAEAPRELKSEVITSMVGPAISASASAPKLI